MKGLNIKKLAAIAVGSALVGSALAPMVAAAVMNTTDQLTKADLVNTTTGAPMVQVAVGSNAAISDFIWAGNIAAKVAQLATTEQSVVVTAGDEAGSTPTVSDKMVDVTVGGTSSYSSESSYTMQDTNYPMNSSTPQAAHEFVREITKSNNMTFLMNDTKVYTYNGSTSSLQVKEEIQIDADAKFDKTTPIKDLGLFIGQSGFKYVLSFGSATNNGIPAESLAGSGLAFDDGDNDNVVIPFLGESYTVNQIDKTASPITMRLIKESSKTTYYEGNEITGLKGKGAYAGKELKVKIAAITSTGATQLYQARVDLYDSEGNLVDTQTISSGAFLDQTFLSGGTYVLDSTVYISTIALETSTNKGYLTATVGTGVLRLADTKQFPYDSSDTNVSNDYWIANLDFNSAQSTVPSNVTTLQKITIKNSVQVWNNTTGYNPVFAGDQSLIEAHKTGSQEAKFLEGFGLGEGTLGYNFVRLKFDGFKQDKTIITQKIGKTSDCSGVSNTGCAVYKDSGNIDRVIPFYIELGSLSTGTSWQPFYISNATFWYRCDKTDANIRTGDGNYLNGARYTWNADYNSMTDYGLKDLNTTQNLGVTVDFNGVTYTLTGTLRAMGYEGLLADGNCQFSSTDPGTTATYIGMGDSTPQNNTIYYSDTNGARQGKASSPLLFTASSITDTYGYAFTANEEYGKGYLLLNRTTNFSSPYSNFDVTFLGSGKGETGMLVLPAGASLGNMGLGTASNYRAHYLPDIEALGQVSGNSDYVIAQFAVDANSTAGQDMNVNIDTGTGKPIAFPNSELSNWSVDVNAAPNGIPWTLTTNTSSDVYLQKAYLDYGTKVEVNSDYVTITGPETQTYLKLTLIGKGATTTVSGGETLTGLAEGAKGKTTGGTEVTVDKINVTATCPAAGGAVAAPATYSKAYPIGEMVVADTVAPAKAIIVGGYLVNNLARDVVLSDGTMLTEALTASGDRVVDVLNDGSVIVAGYTASDTKQAAQDLIAALDALLG
jgi:hypothetical protein